MFLTFYNKPINICNIYRPKFSELISTVLLVTLLLTYVPENCVLVSVSNELHKFVAPVREEEPEVQVCG